jgi:magnesium transporter
LILKYSQSVTLRIIGTAGFGNTRTPRERLIGNARHGGRDLRITSYIIGEDLHLEEETTVSALSERLADGRPRWIDIVSPNDDELRAILTPLVHDDTIVEDFILKERNLPVAHSEQELYFEFPIIRDMVTFDHEYISFLCMPRLLVTIHDHEIEVLNKLSRDLCQHLHLQRATIASLLFNLMAELVEKNYYLYMDQREKITKLSNKVIKGQNSIDVRSILHLKKNLGRVNIMIEDQLYCINTIQIYEGVAFDIGKQRRNFNNLEDEVRNGFRFLGRYENRLEDIHKHYELMLQEKTNNRLKVLTIVAAIFLPLNLLAGIYGMNFEYIPTISWAFGYHVALGLMALVAIAMVIYFYRAGWFK